MPTLKGTEVSLSCAQCFSYLVSSLINVSVFRITWLAGTSWTDRTCHSCSDRPVSAGCVWCHTWLLQGHGLCSPGRPLLPVAVRVIGGLYVLVFTLKTLCIRVSNIVILKCSSGIPNKIYLVELFFFPLDFKRWKCIGSVLERCIPVSIFKEMGIKTL